MKKNWQETFYNIVAILCLLQCLYPWTFNLCNIRAHVRHRSTNGIEIGLNSKKNLFEFSFPHSNNDERRKNVGDKFLRFVDRYVQNSWLTRRHVVQTYIFTEPFLQPMAPQSNLTVRLLDANGNNGNICSNVVRRNELSLEDIDVIDCLWRQDIDAEKGMYASIQPLENQFETDMQMLSEKSFPQQRLMNAPSGNNYQTYESFLKSYDDDFLVSQKKFDGYDPYFWSDAQPFSDVQDEKQLYVEWEKNLAASLNAPLFDPQSQFAVPPLHQQNESINQSFITSNNNTDLLAPLNDVMLTSAATNASDYAAFEPLLSIFDEPDTSIDAMDWSNHRVSIDQFSPNVDLANSANFIESSFDFAAAPQRPTVADVDSIVTPSLELSTNDITRLFNDRQVALDIANAYEHKTELPDIKSIPDTGYVPSVGRQSLTGAVSPYSASFYPETLDDGDFEIMSEFFHSETPGPREKSPSVPVMQNFPDYDSPSTSYNSGLLDISYPGRDSSDSPGQSSIDHDHHYCSSSDNVVEVEVSSSPMNNYDDRKIMPTPVFTPSIKKSVADDDDELDEYLLASSKDEELAMKLQLPITASDIINMSAARFSKLLKDPSFTSSQTDLIRKIRRRGRNKVAAQNCRQRRLDDLQQLSTEVQLMERERDVLRNRQREMIRLKNVELKRINDLNNKRSQRKP